MSTDLYAFSTLAVTAKENGVFIVTLNRPKKSNAMNHIMWREIHDCFLRLGADAAVRCIVVMGSGRNFSAGLDIMAASTMLTPGGGSSDASRGSKDKPDVGRHAIAMYYHVRSYQDAFTAIEKCGKPVIAAIHGACFGAGVDLITACDVRYATADARFSIKEVDIGLAADVGTLQRLPRVVGNDSVVRELCFTARQFDGREAHSFGLIGRLFDDYTALETAAMETADTIAAKSPVAVLGTKHNLVVARDLPVERALDYVAAWNAAMLQSSDLVKAAASSFSRSKTPPKFPDLKSRL